MLPVLRVLERGTVLSVTLALPWQLWVQLPACWASGLCFAHQKFPSTRLPGASIRVLLQLSPGFLSQVFPSAQPVQANDGLCSLSPLEQGSNSINETLEF